MKFVKQYLFIASLVSLLVLETDAKTQNVNTEDSLSASIRTAQRKEVNSTVQRDETQAFQQRQRVVDIDYGRNINSENSFQYNDYNRNYREYYDDDSYDNSQQTIVRRPRPMSDENFSILCSLIEKQSFESDKIDILQAGVLENYFTCRQCAIIVKMQSFQSGRKSVLLTMRDHIVDLWNISIIIDSLTFLSERDDTYRIFGVDRRY